MDRIAYLKGLLDGQEIDKNSKDGKVLFAICDALDEMVKYTEELEDRVAELEELCDILDEDLGDMEEMLLADDDDDDECGCNFEDLYDDDEDEQYETVCPTCGKCILLDERTLEEGETVCPNCGEELEFDFDEREIEALTADLPTEE
jgi:DNA-directed RNA polymerase subunit RPC12/RpoP